MNDSTEGSRPQSVEVTCPGCFHPRAGDPTAVCPICKYRPNADRSGALLSVGTPLKRYVVGEKLGQGGFGITYRGFDLKLHMKVAVKEYYPSDFVGRSTDRKTVVLNAGEREEVFSYGLKTFIKEARTLAQIQHPRVVRVLNYFEMHGTAYLVMDYLEGEDLATYLKRQPNGRLPWRQAITLMLPVLDGLRKVHEAGFMHRDLKPGNLYWTDDGLVLLDFGSARQVNSAHSHSLLIYSAGYAPYEQYLEGNLTRQGPWTDVYGAAATLYFMLTAQRPPSALERKQSTLRQQPDLLKPARKWVPDVPEALDAVLKRALAVEPEQRLQSMAEFKRQLEAVFVEEEKRVAEEQATEAGRAVEKQRKVEEQRVAEGTRKVKEQRIEQGAASKPPVKWRLRAAIFTVTIAGLMVWGGWVIRSRTLAQPATEPKMVQIPGGCFQMGSPAKEADRNDDERQHQVCVDNFEISQYEVTFEEYDRFCAATKRGKPIDAGWGRGQRPVIDVDWNDAVAYAEWLSRQTGKRYRLPTEAEWEYAARAGTTTAYWWGKDIGRNRANCEGCGSQWDNQKTSPVGSFDPNPWKLYDTAGNVWEWTCSAYDQNYGGAEQTCANNNLTSPRSLRGGSWINPPAWVRSAGRFGGTPTARNYGQGFRLARSL
ncbi:MAG: SUMF1/EgtB/PvdO family nonheme iron enzyme [Candidatus Contendobacter sp.]|nr:SUMF1/EgtB/PvdO family nonheme iron enzyme [Candidatus Contendobacter sp.]MDS4059524.1 SUMF1/EgtB/PvdO family nonheme iron enzyme [Candidatus Contendobacter sp.]